MQVVTGVADGSCRRTTGSTISCCSWSDGYRADASHKGYEVMPCKEGSAVTSPTESFSVDWMQVCNWQRFRWSNAMVLARLDNV